MRLIDAEATLNNIHNMQDLGLMNDILDIEEAIAETPTVDAIPVEYLMAARDNFRSKAYKNAVDNVIQRWLHEHVDDYFMQLTDGNDV